MKTERELALELLDNTSPERRLEAVRALGFLAEPHDEERLRFLLARENVSWVKVAINDVLSAIAKRTEGDAVDSAVQGNEWDTLSYITDAVVHELSHIIARMRLALEDDPDLAMIGLRAECDRIAGFMRALKILHSAASDWKPEQFDLAASLRNVADANAREYKINIDISGPSPCLAIGSRDLIEVVAHNAVRNAVEANTLKDGAPPIVLTWGASPFHAWVVVLDSGSGPPLNARPLFRIGASTKLDHHGMGLAIAEVVAKRLSGDVSLERGSGGGGKFELRWPLR